MLRIVFVLVALALTPACSGSLVHKKPQSAHINDSITQLWARDIKRVARSGDWILTRSYSKAGDIIVALTPGESFSHASIYDAERGTIIEAVDSGVREVPLESLLQRNRYAVIIRPTGQTLKQGKLALNNARSVIGAKFDHAGLVGFNNPEQFYCSELLLWANAIDMPPIVSPSSLYGMGELIYLSGARDEKQLQVAAVASHQQQYKRRPAGNL